MSIKKTPVFFLSTKAKHVASATISRTASLDLALTHFIGRSCYVSVPNLSCYITVEVFSLFRLFYAKHGNFRNLISNINLPLICSLAIFTGLVVHVSSEKLRECHYWNQWNFCCLETLFHADKANELILDLSTASANFLPTSEFFGLSLSPNSIFKSSVGIEVWL